MPQHSPDTLRLSYCLCTLVLPCTPYCLRSVSTVYRLHQAGDDEMCVCICSSRDHEKQWQENEAADDHSGKVSQTCCLTDFDTA